MRFVLVNDRTPFRKTFCLHCCEEIGGSYLREIETLIPYCDYQCYALQREFLSLVEIRRRAAS